MEEENKTKKKKSFFKSKLFLFAILPIFFMMLVTATLTGFLSNTITGDVNVKSPITINVGEEDDVYTLDMFAGESTSIETTTEIHIDGLTGHIAENKISNFDGVGISVEYRVDAYLGVFQLPVCVVDEDAYFYIGDPTEVLNKGVFDSTTTFIAEQDLEPKIYSVESKVIMASSAVCETIPEPIFIADSI